MRGVEGVDQLRQPDHQGFSHRAAPALAGVGLDVSGVLARLVAAGGDDAGGVPDESQRGVAEVDGPDLGGGQGVGKVVMRARG